ncbi:hypothetical protein, partial [uncultured Deefgea sp.]|uniref:hypothetical protein n=1 Tax=uncultured Deefgea sp. TaxID=1304914 RepID=UPI0025959DCE
LQQHKKPKPKKHHTQLLKLQSKNNLFLAVQDQSKRALMRSFCRIRGLFEALLKICPSNGKVALKINS